jgi:HNH endonuclease
MEIDKATASRFWTHVAKSDGCWLWLACKSHGYGRFTVNGRLEKAHRVSLLIAGIEVPPGLVPDHTCRNRACVRPDHMEMVTVRENVLRGVGLSAANARKTHCKYGHSLADAFVYKRGKGYERHCRECNKISCRVNNPFFKAQWKARRAGVA